MMKREHIETKISVLRSAIAIIEKSKTVTFKSPSLGKSTTIEACDEIIGFVLSEMKEQERALELLLQVTPAPAYSFVIDTSRMPQQA